jgi:hypothetical protein
LRVYSKTPLTLGSPVTKNRILARNTGERK